MNGWKNPKWSPQAKKDLNAIVRFYHQRNGNNEYGRKLRIKFRETTRHIEQNEESGQVVIDNVRFVVVAEHFQLIYRIESAHNTVVTVWDGRRDPEELVVD